MADVVRNGFLRRTDDNGPLVVSFNEGGEANPLHVDLGADLNVSATFDSHISTVNTTMTPLAAGATFTGQWEEVVDHASLQVAILTDADSAVNGARVEFSPDTVSVVSVRDASVPANTPIYFSISPEARYFRVVYVNGPTPQTFLTAQVVLRFQAVAPQGPLGAQTDDMTLVQPTQAHVKARVFSGPSTGAWVPLGTDGTGNLRVVTSNPTPATDVSGLAKESTQALRYAGGKLAATASVQSIGDTTILTPTTGMRLRVFWASAINDPDQAVTPRIILKFGTGAGTELYRGYAFSHWEVFTGAVNQPLVVNLDSAGDVAVTIHYQEVA